MTNRSLAQPAHQSTRVTRGIVLADEQEHRINRIYAHTWTVPSCTTDETYTVRTDRGTCDCSDPDRGCKHQIAVEILASRRRRARKAA